MRRRRDALCAARDAELQDWPTERPTVLTGSVVRLRNIKKRFGVAFRFEVG